MEFLTSRSDRAYTWAMRQNLKAQELRDLVFPLVIEAVHPSQFSVLPPSPKALSWKARKLELVTTQEALTMGRYPSE